MIDMWLSSHSIIFRSISNLVYFCVQIFQRIIEAMEQSKQNTLYISCVTYAFKQAHRKIMPVLL
jgi:hypothetical protein